MYAFYSALTLLLNPFVPLLLRRRLGQGKEDRLRVGERMGHVLAVRPAGKLLWIHAASVGESNAVLPLIEKLLHANTHLNILLTTTTVTSAALMGKRLPQRAMHQFAPVDTPQSVGAFLAHWKPGLALWVDSELWPNLIMQTYKSGVPLGLINARMSQHSFASWQKYARSFIAQLLQCFSFCVAQSEEDAARLRTLGMKTSLRIGNLKYDAAELPCNEVEKAQLQQAIAARPCVLAASTHPGEEAIIARVHDALKASFPNLLTIIVPRHATRGDDIAAQLAPRAVAQRSKQQPLTDTTELYLADTMGELGLFYRLSHTAFIGGTLVPHGGQNPLEAARLGCALVLGPHMENFADVAAALEKEQACLRIGNEQELLQAWLNLLSDAPARARLAQAALQHVKAHAGAVAGLMNELQPYLA